MNTPSINFMSPSIKYDQPNAAQILGVFLQFGDDLTLDNRTRNRPGRIDRDRPDGGGQRRRLMVHLAHDGGMALYDAEVLHRLDRSRGNVHHHISSNKIYLDVGDTLRARFQLAGANIGGHIECLQSRLVDLAALLQACTALEVPHRIGKCIIPTISISPVLRQVAFSRKALAQPLDILCRGISSNWLGNRSPTAQVRDPPIELSRLP